VAFQSPGFAKALFPLLGVAAFAGLLLAGIFAFRGRGGQTTGAGGLPCVETGEQKEEGESQTKTNLAVQVGIDGSASMLGFVQEGSSRYITVIQKLDDLLRPSNIKTDLGSGVESVQVDYFRLGVSGSSQVRTKQALGENGTSFLDAKFPRFYCYGQPKEYPCVTSSLHQVLEIQAAKSTLEATPTPSPNLSEAEEDKSEESLSPTVRNDAMQILITDLEPDNAAIGEMPNRISTIFAQHPDYKAFLLGIPSEFNGMLYSADQPDSIKTPYQSSGNPEQDGRPFYLFVIGPSPVVQTFVERFMDRVGRDMATTIKASSFQRQASPILLNINSTFGENKQNCVYRESILDGKRLTTEQETEWLILEQEECDGKYKDITLKNVKSQPSWLLRGGAFSADLFRSSEPFVKVTDVSLEDTSDIPYLNLSLKLTGEESSSDEQPIFITLDEKNLDEIIWQDWSSPINKLEGRKTQQLMDFVKSVRGKVSQDQDALRFCLGYVKS